ncbi:MAG TPA: tRNA1(Val) (adenine(37)-N6)-methyltransferase [Candidatus Binatia bacterium]
MGQKDTPANKNIDAQIACLCEPSYDNAEATALRAGEETLDTLFNGQLRILQTRKGYRFSLDAVLLAHFASDKAKEKIADLGTGNGVIPMILAYRNPLISVLGVEVQEGLAYRARRNVQLNNLDKRIRIIQGDVRAINRIVAPESFGAVLCNPPYRKPTSGRLSPSAERKIARHEIMGTLHHFLEAGRYLLKANGRMSLIYPAVRCIDLLQGMRDAGLEPKRLRIVYSSKDAEASLILAEGVKGGRSGAKIMAPLFIYERGKTYSAEVAAMLHG